MFPAIRGLPGYTQRLWRRQGRGLVILLAQGRYRVIMQIYKEKKTMDEKTDYSDPTVLAQTDTAIEIMATRVNMTSLRILEEESKSDDTRDEKLLNRLHKELQILLKERDRMYQGDQQIKNKIFEQYAPEVKEYFISKKNNVR